MAKNKSSDSVPIRRKLFDSTHEISQGIEKLRSRIVQVEELKRDGLPYRDALKVTTEYQIRDTIREIFGDRSPEFHEHQHYRIKVNSKAGVDETITLLQDLVVALEEKRLHLMGFRPRPAGSPQSETNGDSSGSQLQAAAASEGPPAGADPAQALIQQHPEPARPRRELERATAPPSHSHQARKGKSVSEPRLKEAEAAPLRASTPPDVATPIVSPAPVVGTAPVISPSPMVSHTPVTASPVHEPVTEQIMHTPLEINAAQAFDTGPPQAGIAPVTSSSQPQTRQDASPDHHTLPPQAAITPAQPRAGQDQLLDPGDAPLDHLNPPPQAAIAPAHPESAKTDSAPMDAPLDHHTHPAQAAIAPTHPESAKTDSVPMDAPLPGQPEMNAEDDAWPVTVAMPDGQITASDMLSVIRKICMRFHNVARQLRQRSDDRSTLEVEDEIDVQDVLRAILSAQFESIHTEAWNPGYAADMSRTDLLLQQEGIVIVVKKTKQGVGAKTLTDQLRVDIQRYLSHPLCKTLVCFVYDPEGRIGNPTALQAALVRQQNNRTVEILIAPT